MADETFATLELSFEALVAAELATEAKLELAFDDAIELTLELACRELLATELLLTELDSALLAIELAATELLLVELLRAELLMTELLIVELFATAELLAEDMTTVPLLDVLAVLEPACEALLLDDGATLEFVSTKLLAVELLSDDSCALELVWVDDCVFAVLLAFALLLDEGVSALPDGSEEPPPPPQPTSVKDALSPHNNRIFLPSIGVRILSLIVYYH